MATVVGRYLSGLIERFLHADTPDGDLVGSPGDRSDVDTWGDVEARRLRYALAWALYQNTAYRDLHAWAPELRRTCGLYSAIRNVYNPADRLVEFHAAHVYGGAWDDAAGDGKEVPSAAPIIGDGVTDALRRAIARLWRDSLWSQNVESWVRNGALFGDAPVKVAYDAARGKVVFEVVPPKAVRWAAFDMAGHVQGYVIERLVDDPRRPARPDPTRPSESPRRVTFEERCWRDGDAVVFETYLVDGGKVLPWDWSLPADRQRDGVPAWEAPYGFVPMVWTRHVAHAGLDYGLSEFHTELPKIMDLDDSASKLRDQVRKVVEPKWAFFGARSPRNAAGKNRAEFGAARDADAERDTEGALWFRDPAGSATPLVAPLPIADALAVIVDGQEDIEKAFPELRFDRLRAGGEISGEALRVAREPTETKIGRRRRRYDPDLVRLNQMGVAIGGYHLAEGRDARLDAFAGFGLESYAAGDLDHQIGPRKVFGTDPFEDAALRTAVYTGVSTAVAASIPWRVAMREAGYTDDQIDEMETLQEEETRKKLERAQEFGLADRDDEGDETPRDDFEGGEDGDDRADPDAA